MPNYPALRAAIDADPGNAARSDAEVATLLNVPGPPVAGVVSPNRLLMWGAATGARAKIEAGKSDPAIGSICLTVIDLLGSGSIGLDTADPGNLSMLAVLVSAGICTQDQATALAALGATPGPSAAVASFGVAVTDQDIAHARSL